MKKFLFIALVFMLAVPAFAANSSSDNIILKSGEKITVGGREMELKIASSEDKPETPSGYELIGAYDATLVWTDDGSDASADYFAVHSTLGIDFGVSGIAKAMHKVGGSWKEESSNGSVVTVSSLSPFALYKTASGTTPAPAPGKRSPQTGYNTVLWAISAAAMVACAGYCFANARRKDAE